VFVVPECRKTLWDGCEAFDLRAFSYRALVVPSLGANVINLEYDTGKETFTILRTPPSAKVLLDDPFAWGVPVLFPPNRISGAFYEWDGVRYEFPVNRDGGLHIHGVLHNRPWPVVVYRVDDEGALVQMKLDTRVDKDLRRYFPLDVVFTLEVCLTAKGLEHCFTVENFSGYKFPAGLAYHTAFKVPFRPGGSKDNIRLLVPLEAHCIDDPVTRLPAGKTISLGEFESRIAREGAPPLEQGIDALFTAKPENKEAIIRDLVAGWEVFYKPDAINRYWIIWNSEGKKDFIAVEPQSQLSNAMKLSDPERFGVKIVPPRKNWSCNNTIGVRLTDT
jgi:aldose 1-epimerase